ncbi:SigE family RNA polymerase sigma factor [Cryptosporangium phraense]|uniref:SigE family RNA polymerase sigma factor n=1 Tax=Cryptosporangium phraense TaxID=2593070 RepID=UPI00197AE4E8|nr:SigE family RNA polymerase sigma factor [Cryptosporangium phraense]
MESQSEAEFAAFYAAHFPSLCKQLYAYVGDRGAAQDLVQEAFARGWARWSTLHAYDEPAAWVRTVALRLAVSRWRRARRSLAFLAGQREQPVVPPPDPTHVALVAALALLPSKQRKAIVLHYLADVPIAEIAAGERVAEGTVKSWLHRGRTALASELGEPTVDGRIR